MVTYFLIALLCAIIQAVSSALTCPPPNDACDCGDESYKNVYCRGITSIPAHLPSNVTLLDLDSNNLGSALLKNQIDRLEHLQLMNLYLSGTGLQAIETRAFMSLSSLQTIDLSNNKFERLEGAIFYGLFQLENLFLKKSSIYQISSTVFTYTPSLRYLDLSRNQLYKVTNEFVTLSNLKRLDISNNEISSISDNAFENLIRLSDLDITGNHLTVPRAELFKHIVLNNGTLKLRVDSNLKNQWECCGQQALHYYDFLHNLNKSSSDKDQFDIKCSSPDAFAGYMLSGMNRDEVEKSDCHPVTTEHSSLITKTTTSIETDVITKKPLRKTTTSGFSAAIIFVTSTIGISASTVSEIAKGNSLSRLSNGQIAVIFIVVIAAVIVITALVVRNCVTKRRKQAFGEFVDNLPSAMEIEDDDALTTKTYRHDAPVYGSTGMVFDRHRRGIPDEYDEFNEKNASGQPEKYSNIAMQENRTTQKRKPPPYDPPSSPEGFEKAYEGTQFNNSSSVCIDDYSGYNRMLGRIASCPTEYDSDDGNVLWNIRNIK